MSGRSDSEDLRLHLQLLPGDRLAGWIQTDGGAERTPFDGWLELMTVLDALRLPAVGDASGGPAPAAG